ncbi:MAG: di-trans,poly-cis-decaprenylcistransferase [Epsilonproteobacteria bacterium]|jgi:undecaprenyl diphosphate synthase|nr:di-trans,poly-cis-decaprenylcistransferase [Campylobacterota bacterium]NPA89624.1 di-trans,poly-cis-decaprenylcistransferase [Campylobacterota bacterium]
MNLAIIMDGNGRWAKQRGLKRVEGHRQGVEVVRKITTYCAQRDDVENLILFAFSTENWKRPKFEVNFLMKLLDEYLDRELETYLKNGVALKVIGDISKFSPKLKAKIEKTEKLTAGGKNLTQVLALNYGGRDEIVRGVKRLIAQGEEITIENLQSRLDFPYDVDLMVRTSGEVRISNFLLWQLAYSELAFTPTFWPDFTPEELEEIIKDFYNRERRFGGIK